MRLQNDLDDHLVLYISNIISTSLSIIGSLWITYHFIARPKGSRKVHLKLIMGIALADLGYSVANIMSAIYYEKDSPLCKTEGFIRQFSGILSIFMVTCTAVFCYLNSRNSSTFNRNSFFWRAVGVCISICFLLALA